MPSSPASPPLRLLLPYVAPPFTIPLAIAGLHIRTRRVRLLNAHTDPDPDPHAHPVGAMGPTEHALVPGMSEHRLAALDLWAADRGERHFGEDGEVDIVFACVSAAEDEDGNRPSSGARGSGE